MVGPTGRWEPEGWGRPKISPFFPPPNANFVLSSRSSRASPAAGPPGCRTMTLGSWTPSEKTDRNWRRERNKRTKFWREAGGGLVPFRRRRVGLKKSGTHPKILHNNNQIRETLPSRPRTHFSNLTKTPKTLIFAKFGHDPQLANFRFFGGQIRPRPPQFSLLGRILLRPIPRPGHVRLQPNFFSTLVQTNRLWPHIFSSKATLFFDGNLPHQGL